MSEIPEYHPMTNNHDPSYRRALQKAFKDGYKECLATHAAELQAENERLIALLKDALDEMCRVVAPDSTYTDVVDKLDAALSATKEGDE